MLSLKKQKGVIDLGMFSGKNRGKLIQKGGKFIRGTVTIQTGSGGGDGGADLTGVWNELGKKQNKAEQDLLLLAETAEGVSHTIQIGGNINLKLDWDGTGTVTLEQTNPTQTYYSAHYENIEVNDEGMIRTEASYIDDDMKEIYLLSRAIDFMMTGNHNEMATLTIINPQENVRYDLEFLVSYVFFENHELGLYYQLTKSEINSN